MMTSIYLNHAKTKAFSGWSVAILLIGCILSGALIWHYTNLSIQISALEAERQRLMQPKQTAFVTKGNSLVHAKENTQTTAIISAIADIKLPWLTLFKTLEASINEDIKLLRLEPNANSKRLRLKAIAFNLDAMMAYVNRLSKQADLRQVHLVSHEATDVNGTPAVAFHVEAQWHVK
ncbi:MAG TPA: hypothetical protein PLJ94_07740 [Methylotenera sp.]|nr:hypothetical protein [Methylotenera sp.]HPM48688.1 hypothetical protein [Methylotenera sp.]